MSDRISTGFRDVGAQRAPNSAPAPTATIIRPVVLNRRSSPFALAAAILTVTPGQDTLLVVRNVLRGGSGDGAVTTLGICSGLLIHAHEGLTATISTVPHGAAWQRCRVPFMRSLLATVPLGARRPLPRSSAPAARVRTEPFAVASRLRIFGVRRGHVCHGSGCMLTTTSGFEWGEYLACYGATVSNPVHQQALPPKLTS